MEQDDPPSEKAPGEFHPATLNYRSAAADRVEISKLQVFCGLVLSVIALMVAVFVGILGSVGSSNPLPLIIMLVATVIGLVLWAIVSHRRGNRGLAMGIWIGFGLTVLIEGICFSNMRL